MEKIIAKYKFEFFAVDTYKNYNKWPRQNQRTVEDFLPKKGKEETSWFNMSSRWEEPVGKLFTLDKRQSYVSEDYWKKNSFNLLVHALVRRVTIVLSKNEKKNQIKLSVFGFMKGKKTGKKYYWKTSDNIHLSFNTKINDFFVITQTKRGTKWVNTITRNNFKGVSKQLLTLPGIIEGLLLADDREKFEDSRDDIANAWQDTLIKLQQELNISEKWLKTKFPTNILKHIVLPWFLSKKQIKLPNNWRDLIESHYPGMRILRKYKMNLGKAVLHHRDIYSKYANKLLNTVKDFNIWTYKRFFDTFGRHDIKKLSKSLFEKEDSYTNISEGVIDKLTPQEKNNLISLFNKTLTEDLQFNDVNDHVNLKERLFLKGIKVKLNSTNQEEFDNEHLDWSTQLAEAQRTREITYIYNPLFVEEVEKPIVYNKNTYSPYILKNDIEYNEEGTYQRHCVGSYIDRYSSDIISIRKDNGKRITLEYKIDPISKKTYCVQSRLKFNAKPDEEWKEVMKVLDLTISRLNEERLYVNPEVKIRNLRTQEIKILDKDDTQVINPYNFNQYQDEWELEPLRNEVMEPIDDLPF